jgi:GT2 family glycosyltransferase
VNIGIRAAGDSDVVLCNDDALLESPGGFQLLQDACVFDESIGVIGATTNITGQILQYRNSQMDGHLPVRIVPHIAFVCVLIPYRTRNALSLYSNGRGMTDGLLDERYCLDYGVEDADYCEQVTRAGLKVAVHDGCYVDHGSLTSTYRGDPRAAKSFAQNYRLLMEKWGKLESQPK